ncbi:uncharacterized protein MYCFIDRAFT_203297 [Pseudocercospora fijiensis CIRAD86]|uniref:Uncharacterized protein n=1 Tax=Pseudocercospora fijiensis (strain CIRAD86) TaxID=383855 RepID=M3AZ97_PSEFD|nr:uncharacterized protein MYCFIDRAFT_203297 [Pseudocercospora fijiensis CIRAD86]EME82532.1 hypothetical protein MYCFIDRAFT_203297 [Pseudocercospora fijiensis CIRAD86]
MPFAAAVELHNLDLALRAPIFSPFSLPAQDLVLASTLLDLVGGRHLWYLVLGSHLLFSHGMLGSLDWPAHTLSHLCKYCCVGSGAVVQSLFEVKMSRTGMSLSQQGVVFEVGEYGRHLRNRLAHGCGRGTACW